MKTMNKCKNFARFFLCVFAIVGVTACSSSSDSSNSSDPGDPLSESTQDILTLSLDGVLVPDYMNITIGESDGPRTYAIDGGSGSGACSVDEGTNDAVDITNDANLTSCTSLSIEPHTVGTETIILKKAGDDTYLDVTLDIMIKVTQDQDPKVTQDQGPIFLGADANTYAGGTIAKKYSETPNNTFTESFDGGVGTGAVTFVQDVADGEFGDVVQVTSSGDPLMFTFTFVGVGTEKLTITKEATSDYNKISVTYTIEVGKGDQEDITLTVDGSNGTLNNNNELTGLVYNFNGDASSQATLTLGGGSGDGTFEITGGNNSGGVTEMISGDNTTLTLTPNQGATTSPEVFTVTKLADTNYNEKVITLRVSVAKADQAALELPADYKNADNSYTATFFGHKSLILNIPITGGIDTGTSTADVTEGANLSVNVSNEVLELSASTFSNTEETVLITKTADNYNDATLTLTVTLSSDVDDNGDGLIDIWSLEQLSNIRFDLDGTHYNNGQTATNEGCPVTGCVGYELKRDLDFTDDVSYNGSSVNSDYNPLTSNTTSIAATKAVWTPRPNTDNSGGQVLPAAGLNIGWRSIGGSDENPFTGTFEGNGFTISNLYHRSFGSDNAGLFRTINKSTILRNLTLNAVYVIKRNFAAGLVGTVLNDSSGGSIDNSHITGNSFVEATSDKRGVTAGGLVAHSRINISNSSSSAQVTGSSSFEDPDEDGLVTGGLVGKQSSENISHSYATGNVSATVTGDSVIRVYAGGLVGRSDGMRNNIIHSYATGAVTGTSIKETSNSGGLVGYQNNGSAEINYSYATGNVSATSSSNHSYAGGLVGNNISGTITYSYATGSVMATTTSDKVEFISDLSTNGTHSPVTSSCGSGGTNDGAEAGSKLIDLLKSNDASSGDVAIHTSWECYDADDNLVDSAENINLFAEWGKYYYDFSNSNNAISKDEAIFDSTNDITPVWDFGDDSSLPTIAIPTN